MSQPNSTKTKDNSAKPEALSPQIVIENLMQEIIEKGHYDAVFLFSLEGLPLAQAITDIDIDQACLVNVSLVLKDLQNMIKTIADIEDLREIVIEGFNRRKVVFRFLEILGQPSILAVIVTPRKSYKGLTNQLIRTINKVMTE